MRFVLIGPVYPYRGGIAHYTTMLYRTLREIGYEVLLVSFRRQYPKWFFPGQSDRDPTTRPMIIEGVQYWIDSLNPLSWLWTFIRLGRYQPDGIVLQWWTPFWALLWVVLGVGNKLFLHRPLIFICHNVLPHETQWWHRGLTKMVLRWGTGFIVQSDAEKLNLLNILPQATTVVMPHPVYDMFSDARVSKAVAREQLELALDAPTLLFFGIVREYKGLYDLLIALPQIQAQLPAIKLLVAGEFWDDKVACQTTIQKLGIEGVVRIDDRYIPNDEVSIYFSAADVVVAPYRSVTGSGVVQMARGFGLPVITTLVGGLGDVVIEGKTGLLVPPQNPKALTKAIVRYFQENLAETMTSAVLQSAEDFSWKRLGKYLGDMVSEFTDLVNKDRDIVH
ncbi:MAG: glycosyltransferase [Anaerolineae bacterium]|nr:glycosyltransferase [Anaerolineae bacterium]